MAKHSWLSAALLATAVGCGSQQKFSPAPSAQEETPARAQTRKPSKDATKSTTVAPAKEDLDCQGVKVHAGHPSCDKDDVQVASGDVEAPKPVIVENPTPTPPPASVPAPAPAPAPAPSTPPQDPNVVVFRIKAGTGNQPWNTADTMVTVKVGQTLRIVNDDTVTHRLHTGGAPCPHGTNFAPGASYDCVATRALDPAATPGRTYDHIVGDTALFFLKAVP